MFIEQLSDQKIYVNKNIQNSVFFPIRAFDVSDALSLNSLRVHTIWRL